MTLRKTLLLALCLPPAFAQAEDIGFERYYDKNEFSLTSPGAQRFGLYGTDNPAGLHHLKGGDALFNWTSDEFLYDDDQRWQAILAAPGVSFSFGRDHRGGTTVRDYAFSFGGGTDDASAGLSIGWYGGDTDAQDLRTHFTLGTLTRPNRYTSLGLTGTLATDTDYYEGVVDLAVRPMGTPALTLFADYAIGNDQSFSDGHWSVGGSSEVMPGVRLSGRYFDTDTVTLGLHVSLGNSGFSAQSHQPDEGDGYQSYGIRLGTRDRTLSDAWAEPDQYMTLTLDERMTYQTLDLLDQRQALLDTLRAIDAARIDNTVDGIVVNTAQMKIPPTMAWEVKTALDRFRADGKRVVMYVERGRMTELLLTTAADTVIMDPAGTLTVPGFASGSTYLGDLLDHWGVGVEELRNLEYKTAFESVSRTEMSAADREQRQAMIDDFYTLWQDAVTDGHGLSASDFDALIDGGLYLSAEELQQAGIVDRIERYSDLEDHLDEIAGARRRTVEPDGLRVLHTANDHQWGPAHRIAVVYATGMTATDSGMKTRELAETLGELRENPSIKAVVLRVDSPGGDVLAADLLGQAVKQTQAEKPVVVSMGDLAASGGYWIAMHADTLIAAPTTVTGSIGVTSLRLWDDGLGERLHLNSDFVSRGRSADINTGIGLPIPGVALPRRALTDEERTRLMSRIDDWYDEFVRQAARARDMPEAKMRRLAAGRIYSGAAALEAGLVDELGSLTDAIDRARELAGLALDDKIQVVERPEARVSSFGDLLYLIDPEARALKGFNTSLYPQQYLEFLANQNGQPLVLLPYEYFEVSLQPSVQ